MNTSVSRRLRPLLASTHTTPKVLVVDDSRVAREVLRPALEQMGCRVVSLLGPAGVLPVILREAPHLVLFEVALPGLRVGQLIESMRQASPSSVPTVLLFSQGTDENLRALAERADADGYVRKTEDAASMLHQVLHVLAEALEERQANWGPPVARLPKVLFVGADPCFLGSRPEDLLDPTLAFSEHVASGCEALRRVLSRTPPDLVIADAHTSDVSGVALYHALVANDGCWQQRFVLAVGSEHFDQTLTSFLLQVDVTVLHKPAEREELCELVRLLNSAPRAQPAPL